MVKKSHYDPAKERWREAWYHFIRKHRHSLRGSPKDWKVAFFPGEEALELAVYDRLGVPRENLLGLEREARSYEKLRKKGLGIRLTDEPIDALDFFEKTGEKFDMVNLDYEGTLNEGVVRTLGFISGRQLLAEDSIFGLTVYAKMEKDFTRKMYYSQSDLSELERLHLFDKHTKIPTSEEFNNIGIDFKKLKEENLTSIVWGIMYNSRENLETNPVYKRNPRFSVVQESIKKYLTI